MAKNKLVNTPVAQKHVPGLLKGLMKNADVEPNNSYTRREGHALPILRFGAAPDTGHEAFGIDMSNAPIPARSYTADGCVVVHQEDDVQIIFTQRCIFANDIESALVIRFSPHAIVNLSAAFAEIKNPSVEEILKLIKVSAVPFVKISSKPRQVVNMTANICSTAISGHETSLEFFHSSAFAVRKSAQQNEIEVEPIVRVELRTSVFAPLVDEIHRLASAFK